MHEGGRLVENDIACRAARKLLLEDAPTVVLQRPSKACTGPEAASSNLETTHFLEGVGHGEISCWGMLLFAWYVTILIECFGTVVA